MSLAYDEFFREICMRMLHIEKELEKVVGREKALEIIGKGNENALIEFTEKQMREVGPIRDFEEFKKFQRESLKSPFLSSIVTGTTAKETPKEIVSHITDCLWHKTFKELNATDLGYIMCCHPDFTVASHYHPKIKLRRTKTLMKGDKYCNHTYYWEE